MLLPFSDVRFDIDERAQCVTSSAELYLRGHFIGRERHILLKWGLMLLFWVSAGCFIFKF